MAQMAVLERKCTGCGRCADACPFAAIERNGLRPEFGAACRMCGICARECPSGAIIRVEALVKRPDLSAWKGILVFAEASGGRIHPVSLELIGKARELAQCAGQGVRAVLCGCGVEGCARELMRYGVDEIWLYDAQDLSFFRAEVFSDCVEDCVAALKPAAVLIGATALGRSLAPRLSTRFRTGLTADCTGLLMRPDGNLVQTRPAFGGNIMAQIITPDARPQFATVRYKVMDAPARAAEPSGSIVRRPMPPVRSLVRHVSTEPVPAAQSISEAEVIVAGGRGLRKQPDIDMIRELAALLGGEWAVTRPLVEKGWAPAARQIGLSGRAVRPRLIITCGVSGAIQFVSCMNQSGHIVAVNLDPDAPIFKAAHVAIVGDLYEVVPRLISNIREAAR